MRKTAEVLLADGPAGLLVIRAQPLPCEGQRLEVDLDGTLVADEDVTGDSVNLRIPVPASETSRRVRLQWAKTAILSPDDPREVAARIEYLDLAPLRRPSVLRLPHGLAAPGLEYGGVHADGWVEQEAHVVLAGGAPSDLVVRADVLEAPSQRLELAVGGEILFSETVPAGPLELQLPIAASDAERRVDLRFATAARLAEGDPREVAARLKLVGFAGGEPPAALRTFPGDLMQPHVRYAGIYDDGWLERTSCIVLRGGAAGTLVVRAEALAHADQRLEVVLDGETLHSERIAPGPVNVRLPVPATDSERRLELRWAAAPELGAGDPRRVAARLTFVGVVAGRAWAVIQAPADLLDPELDYCGAYDDGWLEQTSRFELAGGDAADLIVRALVPSGTDLAVVVDGETLASEAAVGKRIDLRVAVPPRAVPRRVELRWSEAYPISHDDPRVAAAKLEFLGLVASPGRSTARQAPGRSGHLPSPHLAAPSSTRRP